jgi:hypothetical protein
MPWPGIPSLGLAEMPGKVARGAVAGGIGAVTAVALMLSWWPRLPSSGREEAGRRPGRALATASGLGEA